MKKLCIFLFFKFNLLMAVEMTCEFEEVYTDGSTQQGIFLIKNDLFRYEYLSKSLYTIFYKNNDFFIVQHNQQRTFQKLHKDNIVLMELIEILRKYPNIPPIYSKNGVTIKLEKSEKIDFYKRISIQSDNLNLSIFLNNCKKNNYHDRYFNYSPYFDLVL